MPYYPTAFDDDVQTMFGLPQTMGGSSQFFPQQQQESPQEASYRALLEGGARQKPHNQALSLASQSDDPMGVLKMADEIVQKRQGERILSGMPALGDAQGLTRIQELITKNPRGVQDPEVLKFLGVWDGLQPSTATGTKPLSADVGKAMAQMYALDPRDATSPQKFSQMMEALGQQGLLDDPRMLPAINSVQGRLFSATKPETEKGGFIPISQDESQDIVATVKKLNSEISNEDKLTTYNKVKGTKLENLDEKGWTEAYNLVKKGRENDLRKLVNNYASGGKKIPKALEKYLDNGALEQDLDRAVNEAMGEKPQTPSQAAETDAQRFLRLAREQAAKK